MVVINVCKKEKKEIKSKIMVSQTALTFWLVLKIIGTQEKIIIFVTFRFFLTFF